MGPTLRRGHRDIRDSFREVPRANSVCSPSRGTSICTGGTFATSQSIRQFAALIVVDPINGGCANPYVYAYGDPLDHPDLSGQGGCVSTNATLAGCTSSLTNFSASCIVALEPGAVAHLANQIGSLPGVAAQAAVSDAICFAIGSVGTPIAGAIAGAACGIGDALAGAQVVDSLESAAKRNEAVLVKVGAGLFTQSPVYVKVYTQPAMPCGS